MRASLILAYMVFVGFGCASSAAKNTPPGPRATSLNGADPSGRFVILVKDHVSRGELDAYFSSLRRAYGIEPIYEYKHTVKGLAARLTEQQADRIRLEPHIQLVEPDQVMTIPLDDFAQLGVTPDDKSPYQWALDRIDQENLPTDGKFTAGQTGAGQCVYVFDTGLRTSHEQFEGRAQLFFDVFGGEGEDQVGHGTAVASLIVGKDFGAAKKAQVLAVKVLNGEGTGLVTDIIKAIDTLTERKAKPGIVNLSFSESRSAALNEAIERSMEQGFVYIAAAGNNGHNATHYSPASARGIVAVGATDRYDRRSVHSNYGAVVYAPGAPLRMAGAGKDDHVLVVPSNEGKTSYAAPFVSGVAALYREVMRDNDQASITKAIFKNASFAKVGNAYYGAGNLVYSGLREGEVTAFTCEGISGWVWDPAYPNRPLVVQLWFFPAPPGISNPVEVVANQRGLHGDGNGQHSFTWTPPESLKDSTRHDIEIRVKDSNFVLKSRGLWCAGN